MIGSHSTAARRALAGAALVAATALVALALAKLPLVRAAENWLLDIRLVRFSPAAPPAGDVVLVTIDEDTLASLPYRTPVDRGFLASLVSALDARGARAIGLDLLLDQPTEPAKDARLREVLASPTRPVVVATADRALGLTPAQAAFLGDYVDGLGHGPALVERDHVDGTVRRMPLRAPDGTPTFIAALASAAGVALPANDTLTLNYPRIADGAGAGFARYSALWAASSVPAGWIEGRIVLIGVDLPLEDRHRTPFAALGSDASGHRAGIEIHAHALAQLIRGEAGRAAAPGTGAILVLLAATLGAGLGLVAGTALGFAGIQVLGGAALIGAAFGLSLAGGPVVPVLAPLIAFSAANGAVTVRRWYRARRQAAFLRDAFSRYVDPVLVDRLVADPGSLRLDGERRETTFLFTDIAGFTALTESMPAESLVTIINEYIDGTCRIAMGHGGIVEKIVGDALHVMFNAPLDQPDHAARAVECALAIDGFCRDFERRMHERDVAFGETRIGVNTGETVVGNMGGSLRFDYSATGDAINVAARLESANRHLGTRICVGAETRARCPDAEFRPIGNLALKGKTAEIPVFEPLAPPVDAGHLSDYLEAYRLMASGADTARAAFTALAERQPDDRLAAFHAGRLARGEVGTRIVLIEK